jgi:hypothetical protein
LLLELARVVADPVDIPRTAGALKRRAGSKRRAP